MTGSNPVMMRDLMLRDSERIIGVHINAKMKRALRLDVLQPLAQEGLKIHFTRGLPSSPAISSASAFGMRISNISVTVV